MTTEYNDRVREGKGNDLLIDCLEQTAEGFGPDTDKA
jgi:hypothetical protein